MPLWPQQAEEIRNPASAPYNFVPLPESVAAVVSGQTLDECQDDTTKAGLLEQALPDHDVYLARHNGYFTVTLTTLTPLYVRCPVTRQRFEQSDTPEDKDADYTDRIKNTPDFFYTLRENEPVIPGSSLRGMLRTLTEIITYSKISRVSDQARIFYRAVAAEKDDSLGVAYRQVLDVRQENLRAGYLVPRGNDWYIQPAEMPSSVHERAKGPYFTLRASDAYGNHLLESVLPEVKKFNALDYALTCHDIWFDVQEVTNKIGQKVILIDSARVSADANAYPHAGVLVCTGNMLETGGTEPSPRRKHAVILPRKEGAAELKIASQAVNDYRSALTPEQKKLHARNGMLMPGRPVFYIEPYSGQEVRYFGHSPNFRLPALAGGPRAVTPRDFVPSELRDPQELDMAEAIFGFTDKLKSDSVRQGRKARAYAGRVSVTEATLNPGQENIWFSETPFAPKILATPKPTAYAHYLVQPAPHRSQLRHYDCRPSAETVIRGHKLYWHQGVVTMDALTPDPGDPQTDKVTGEPEAKSTQHTRMKPVDAGVNFTFRIYFDNLSMAELVALCWALEPGGDANMRYAHRLGMGKALGLGSVQLNATLTLSERKERYTTLFDGNKWKVAEKKIKLAAFRDRYEEKLLLELNPSPLIPRKRLADLQRIAVLLKLMEWYDEPYDWTWAMTKEEYGEKKALPSPASEDLFGTLTGYGQL